MGIAIGKLRERLSLVSVTYSGKDDFGQPVTVRGTPIDLWCSYRSLNGSEVMESKERTARRFAEFKIRAQGVTINELYEITYKAMTFNITSLSEDEYKNYITIQAVSKDNDFV
jgi:head-tail adaptor